MFTNKLSLKYSYSLTHPLPMVAFRAKNCHRNPKATKPELVTIWTVKQEKFVNP